MRLLVTGHTDEADPGLGDERVRLIDHAEAGAQYRNQQRRTGQLRPRGVGQRGAHRRRCRP